MLFLNESTKYIGENTIVLPKEVQEMDSLSESMGITPGIFGNYFSENVEVATVEILAEMNSGWDALEKDMLLCEAHAVIQGIPLNENAFTETMTRWWQKIKEFFAKVWGAIRDTFQKALIFITTKFQNAKKWLDANIKDIDAGVEVEVEEFPNIISGNFAKLTPGLFQDLAAGKSKDEYEKWLEAANNNKDGDKDRIREWILGGRDKQKQSVKIAQCKSIIDSVNEWKATFSKTQAEMAADAKNAIAKADAGIKFAKQTEKKDEAEALAGYIKCLKKKMSYEQTFMSVKISAASTAASVAFTCAKKLLIKSKANTK